MEWAWKPMAAVMNENKTDLVYWVPPLYASNILASFASSSGASSPGSSICSSPSLSRTRNLSRRSTLADGTPVMGSRKRRISKRRPLSPKQSIDEIGEDGADLDGKVVRKHSSVDSGGRVSSDLHSQHDGDKKFDGTIKKDLVVEFEAEEIDLVEGISENSIADDIELHNKQLEEMRNKKEKEKKAGNRHRSLPAILKILEKVSHIHEKPKHRPIARRNAKIERTMSSGSQKIKRPSLKVYQNVPKHGSGRRATAPAIPTQPPETEAKEARMVITGKNNSGPRLSIRRASRQNSQRSRSASVTTTGLKVSQVTEAELRSAHLEMMIKILATLYEEKISKQDTEIKTLKDKFKSQDKIVKQVVHNMLEVKADLKSLREHLAQQEESFMHSRSQLVIAQQSIPEEIEDDLEMYEGDIKADSASNKSSISASETVEVSVNFAKCDECSDCLKIHDSTTSSAKTISEDASSMSTVIESNLNSEAYHYNNGGVINLEECEVLAPPDEFQSNGHHEEQKYNYTNSSYSNTPVTTGDKVSKFSAHLEAQDDNECNIEYHKLEDEETEGLDSMEEHFFASQYVCDYHPREEMRVKKSYFVDTLRDIDEDERSSILSRQRSDDSTNI